MASSEYAKLLEVDPEFLEQETARLQFSIQKLVESNQEMQHFHSQDADQIYIDSIKENEDVIRKQHERIQMIHKAIDEIRGFTPDRSHQAGISPITAANGSNGESQAAVANEEEGLYL